MLSAITLLEATCVPAIWDIWVMDFSVKVNTPR